MIQVKDKHFVPFLSKEILAQRVKELAQKINQDYASKDPLIIGVLNGAFIFLSDLFKELEIDCEVTFIRVASYQKMNSSGHVKQIIGLQEDISNRDIILVEDIVDTGLTMQQLVAQIQALKPASLEIVTLLHKPAALKVPLDLKYVGFEIENRFVVGYGLDYDGHGRNLDAVYVLAPTE
ncbi:MAG: hypoxanthine phosphoribosyltransferase [Spirosomataceae bacterium]